MCGCGVHEWLTLDILWMLYKLKPSFIFWCFFSYCCSNRNPVHIFQFNLKLLKFYQQKNITITWSRQQWTCQPLTHVYFCVGLFWPLSNTAQTLHWSVTHLHNLFLIGLTRQDPVFPSSQLQSLPLIPPPDQNNPVNREQHYVSCCRLCVQTTEVCQCVLMGLR